MKFGIVGRIGDGVFRYQGWPTVCRDENGVLYAVSSGHRLSHVCPYGKNVLYISRDEGETWTPPIIINDTALDDRDGGITSLGDGKLLLTYFNHPREFYFGLHDRDNWGREPLYEAMLSYWKDMPESENHAGSFVRLSRDSGKTWEEAVKVPVSSPHGPIRLSDGRLLFLGKEFHSGEYESGAVFAFDSADDGKTWNCLGRVDFPDGCNGDNIHEPDCLELPDGRLLGALRGQGDPVPYRFSIYTTVSEDGGKTWTHPKSLDVNGSPPHLLLHSSGAVVLTYGRRTPPFGERARISYDNGETFGEEIVISEESNNGDLGYPSTVELSDGSLYTVYYQRAQGDDYCSVLYTRWNLPEKE